MTTKTKILRITITRTTAKCPLCGATAKRHSTATRTLREVGHSRPAALLVTYSKHRCTACRRTFSVDMSHLATKGARFTRRVRGCALDLVIRKGLTLEAASLRMRQRHFVHVPMSTIHDWAAAEMEGEGANV